MLSIKSKNRVTASTGIFLNMSIIDFQKSMHLTQLTKNIYIVQYIVIKKAYTMYKSAYDTGICTTWIF